MRFCRSCGRRILSPPNFICGFVKNGVSGCIDNVLKERDEPEVPGFPPEFRELLMPQWRYQYGFFHA